MVLPGLEVLLSTGAAPLQGRRIGLITNHTGLDLEGRSIVDRLSALPGVQVTALFGPEHGIRGSMDEAVPDAVDARTGIPVYSLYGSRTRPTSEQLDTVDLLVYDIQDIGTRFYTYISTLGHCMEAAAAAGLPFLVLDRPNPIGGDRMEGPLADADQLSFTAYHRLPIRHGLTVGELARLFVAEKGLDVELQVVPANGWRRSDLLFATGLPWVSPSPNMRSLTQAMLYPGMGLPEFTNLSVGRGTDTPFERLGAPWMDGRELASTLNAVQVPGTAFLPVRFTPNASRYAGQPCSGVNIVITTWSDFEPVATGLQVACALRRLYPEAWEVAAYSRLLANRAAYDAVVSGASAPEVSATFEADIATFRSRVAPYLLYA